MKVFWSWQSDTRGKTGRHLVRDALKAAIEQLKQDLDVVEPIERETRSELHVDHDRQGILGSPDLARVILEKIEQSSVFIGDVTLTGFVKAADEPETKKKVINSNVAIELGYALHALSDRALLMVMNEYYGTRAELPFDLQTKAGHIISSWHLMPTRNRLRAPLGNSQFNSSKRSHLSSNEGLRPSGARVLFRKPRRSKIQEGFERRANQ
jgi:hypothetical protein